MVRKEREDNLPSRQLDLSAQRQPDQPEEKITLMIPQPPRRSTIDGASFIPEEILENPDPAHPLREALQELFKKHSPR